MSEYTRVKDHVKNLPKPPRFMADIESIIKIDKFLEEHGYSDSTCQK